MILRLSLACVFALSLSQNAMAHHTEDHGAAPQATAAKVVAISDDLSTIDGTLKAVYDVISGPAGPRDWDRFRNLFAPNARLMAVNPRAPGGLAQMTVEDYIARNGPFFLENGFFEQELARTVDRYGGLAHVFSSYQALRNADDETPFMRGINSFQLHFDGTRWHVVTIFWQPESPDLPLPEDYLPSAE